MKAISLAYALWNVGRAAFNQHCLDTERQKAQILNHERYLNHTITYERYVYMRKKIEDEYAIDQYETEKTLVSAYGKVIEALKQGGKDFSGYMQMKMQCVNNCKKWRSLLKRRKLLDENGEVICTSRNQTAMQLTT